MVSHQQADAYYDCGLSKRTETDSRGASSWSSSTSYSSGP